MTEVQKRSGSTRFDVASDWLMREDSLSPSEREALADWLSADPAHRAAYEEARALLLDPALLAALSELRDEGRPLVRERLLAAIRRASDGLFGLGRAWLAAGAVAASFFLVAGGALLLRPGPVPATSVSEQVVVRSYGTGVGERLAVTLDDGSVIRLLGQTEIDVHYDASARAIDLKGGVAFFDVQPDAERPFTVTAGQSKLRAVGTAFAVDALRNHVEVRVYEGIVAASLASDPPTRLGAGEWAAADPDLGVRRGSFAAAPVEDWYAGWVEADRLSLDILAARMNRFSATPIVADGTLPDDLTVSGRFKLSDTDTTLLQLEAALDIDVRRREEEIRLLPAGPR